MVPPIVYTGVQLTTTLVTLEFAVPLAPLVIEQICAGLEG
jgi:hypothetical protein